MDLLFKRQQSNNRSRGVNFRLWGRIELNEDEKAIVAKYKFDQAILIFADQPGLLRNSILIGLAALAVAVVALNQVAVLNQMGMLGALIALAAGIGAGYWWYHQKRETIYVKDLMHGRYFTCDSVVELARKEAWLATVVSFFRQVMESAKHWDGTERHTVDPLPKEEARKLIIEGIEGP